jgi:hypothetical protein
MRLRAWLMWFVCVCGFLWLALDGALHWDEPAYLYTGGYLSVREILAGDFQPSGIAHFYLTRPLHVLMIHAVTVLTGPGAVGFAAVVGVCTSALVGFLVVTRLILGELMPGSGRLNTAMALGLLIPVVPYLAFKTLPENGALLFSALSMLVLLRAARASGWVRVCGLVLMAGLSIALVLWLKGPMLLLLGSGVLAVVVFGEPGVRRVRLLGLTVVAGLAGFGLAYGGVVGVGIDPSIYTGGISRVGTEYEPISARVLNNGVELGWFILVLPLAFLSSRRREVWVMAGWFLIASLPLALLFPSMEARYQAGNVPALIGLTALALDGVLPWVVRCWQGRRVMTGFGVALVWCVVVLSHGLAISVMQHEVKVWQVDAVLGRLDEAYGRGNYAVLTAWPYTDFHYLRYVYPDLPVYTVHRVESIHGVRLSQELMRSSQERYYPDRIVLDKDQMRRLGGKTPVLFGFHENFAVANLRVMVSYVPGGVLSGAIDRMEFYDHLTTGWLWGDGDYDLVEVAREGHYWAFEVVAKGGSG